MQAVLQVVMYHYVRDLPNTRFPRLKGMLADDFRDQLRSLEESFEMATLEAALEFLAGTYRPRRDLCLLTFDDGLREHYETVTAVLAERKIQGLFFLITSALEERRIATAHLNHFLMAGLDFERYRDALAMRLDEFYAEALHNSSAVRQAARETYRWDRPKVAEFKYMLNFMIPPGARRQALLTLFEQEIGPESDFAQELYVSWDEARCMQSAGMLVGGHSHWHEPLSELNSVELDDCIEQCRELLDQRLKPQPLWPFSYPFGKNGSFDQRAVERLQRAGFDCAFSTEVGVNRPGANRVAIRRIDCKDVGAESPRALNWGG